MRKGIYLSFSLLTFYLAGLYRLDVLVFLFAAEILLFVWSSFLPAYFAGNLEFRIALGETQGGSKEKGAYPWKNYDKESRNTSDHIIYDCFEV